MKCSDVPDEAILDVVRACNDQGRWCLTFDLEERLPDLPWKLLIAKCRRLIKRGKMYGCWCGCRGDFYLPGSIWDYKVLSWQTPRS